MRHGNKNAKLNKPADQRKALIRGLTTELLRHGTVTTTMARAKAMRKPVEHMIQLAKDGDDYKRRMAEAFIYDKEVVEALFETATSRESSSSSLWPASSPPSSSARSRS